MVPVDYCTFAYLKTVYNEIKNQNKHNAASLLKTSRNTIDELAFDSIGSSLYIFTPARDMTFFDSSGDQTSIISDEIIGTNGKINLTTSNFLSDELTYTITAPKDDYSFSGTESISVVNDEISVDVNALHNSMISFSESLHDVSIEGLQGDNFSLTFTTYNNNYDQIILSGTADVAVDIHMSSDNNIINISGANTIHAVVTVGESEIILNADNVINNALLKCYFEDEKLKVKIIADDSDLAEIYDLPDRVQMPIPEYDLPSGFYMEGQLLSFIKDEDTMIYYTVDGSDPSKNNGILYTSPIDINHSMIIKAIATKYGFNDSDIIILEYYLPEIEAPISNYEEGIYDQVLYINLYSLTDDANIYYTIDGSDPKDYGILFTTPIILTGNTCLSTYATKDNCVSDITTYYYSINPKEKFMLANSPINQDGVPITEGNSKNTESVTLNILNLSQTQQQGHFVIAFYNNEDALIAFFEKDAELIDFQESIEFTITHDVSSAVKMETYIDEYMVIVNNGLGTGHYSANDTVYATAHPITGSVFKRWIDVGSLNLINGNELSQTIGFIMPESSITLTAENTICYGTPDFSLPNNLLSIEAYAFEGTSMTIVYISDNCTSIGDYAFSNCTNLTQIRIPGNCSISDTAFSGCGNLYIFGTPGTLADSFCQNHTNCVFIEE